MIMNYIEYLDPALIQLGRVDLKLELRLTNKDINTQLFFSILGYRTLDQKEMAEENSKLRKLVADFRNLVPEYEFSLAEIQLFLLENRKSPTIAV